MLVMPNKLHLPTHCLLKQLGLGACNACIRGLLQTHQCSDHFINGTSATL